jgi:hypothetical protein
MVGARSIVRSSPRPNKDAPQKHKNAEHLEIHDAIGNSIDDHYAGEKNEDDQPTFSNCFHLPNELTRMFSVP